MSISISWFDRRPTRWTRPTTSRVSCWGFSSSLKRKTRPNQILSGCVNSTAIALLGPPLRPHLCNSPPPCTRATSPPLLTPFRDQQQQQQPLAWYLCNPERSSPLPKFSVTCHVFSRQKVALHCSYLASKFSSSVVCYEYHTEKGS